VSSFLFYGPGALEKALSLEKEGRKLGDPFGDKGLKIDESRIIVRLLNNLPPGRMRCTLVIGPMNRSTPAASDVLLKSLEEPPKKVDLILWSENLVRVSPTIISRCWPVWCYGEDLCKKEKAAQALVAYLSEGKISEALGVLDKNKKYLEELMRSVSLVLSRGEVTSANKKIWKQTRNVLMQEKITYLGVAHFLLFGEEIDSRV